VIKLYSRNKVFGFDFYISIFHSAKIRSANS
jgi:hypothetical protein